MRVSIGGVGEEEMLKSQCEVEASLLADSRNDLARKI